MKFEPGDLVRVVAWHSKYAGKIGCIIEIHPYIMSNKGELLRVHLYSLDKTVTLLDGDLQPLSEKWNHWNQESI